MSVAGLAARLTEANKGFRALFFQTLEQKMADIAPIRDALFMRIPSAGSGEEWNFTDAIPNMEEWVDERTISRLRVQGKFTPNRSYANGLEIDRDDLMDDRLGLFNPRIRALAEGAARHQIQQVRSLLDTGATAGNNSYDGVSFFNTAHPRFSGGTQSNRLTSAALNDANYEAAVTALEEMTDERGEPLTLMATHLIVPSALKHTANRIVNASLVESSGGAAISNVNAGTAEVLTIKGLSSSTNWYVADLSRELKPLIWLDRMAVQFTSQDSPSDEAVFHQKKFRFGADYRAGYDYGFWQTIIRNEA